MSVFDKAKSLYQWRVHPEDTGKLAVITHRGQEVFKVAMMGFVNSLVYVQRRIDSILRDLSQWCRTYVDDIFAASGELSEHCCLLTEIFRRLHCLNIP